MQCPHCQAENPVTARFCMRCRAALSLICSNCQAELPADARFCMLCGQPVRVRPYEDDARHHRLRAVAPAPIRAQVRADAALVGERRPVTVLFLDVVGSTQLSQQLGPAQWTSLLGEVYEQIVPSIYRYEGTVARLLGDSLTAFFGAPVAHEDDPVRAVQAALDALTTAQNIASVWQERYGITFQMRARLNTGPIVVGPVGDDLRYDYTPMDGVVHLAMRLKFEGEPMTIVVTGHTHRFIEPFFETRPLGAVHVKGVDTPTAVYQVLGAREGEVHSRGVAGLNSPMVGRAAELAILLRLADTVRAGLGRGFLIVGEPGLGKTRLIAEWRAAVEQTTPGAFHWLMVPCRSYGRSVAYHLLNNLLRFITGVSEHANEAETRAALQAQLRALLGDAPADIYPYLCQVMGLRLEPDLAAVVEALDGQTWRAFLQRALEKVLRALLARRPVALILEDIHWADPSSVELLSQLLSLTLTHPLLLGLTARYEPDAPGWSLATAARTRLGGGLHELTLAPLSERDTRQLVANLLQIEALPEPARQLILHKAEGNPFFVEEVIRMLIEQGAIVRRNGGWVAGRPITLSDIPDNLHSLLLARIDRLPDEVKQTLRIAAVIGRQFPVRVLERVLEKQTPRL